MKKQRRDPPKPKRYLSSKSNPDYSRLSMEYYLSQLLPGYPDIKPDVRHEVGEYFRKQIDYIKKIALGWNRPLDRSPSFSKEADQHVIDAIREFGVDALRLQPEIEEKVRTNPNGDLYEITDELGIEVCAVIRYWVSLAAFSPSERRRATKRLGDISKALTAETRGRRRPGGFGSGVVKAVYYDVLFDLYQIDNALRSQSGPRNFNLNVKAASEDFGMPIEQIREFRNLDENNQPKGSPLSIKEMARILTARRLRLTQHTVSNLLASKI